MNNCAIDDFFDDNDLSDKVQKQIRPPNEIWFLKAAETPVIIQTQEDANRMRIVAFVAEDAADLDNQKLVRLMQANYHSALDARYAITDDGQLVAVFLHPFEELSREQFVLGFCQVVNCAATFGGSYSGGTMTFGRRHLEHPGNGHEPVLVTSLQELVERLKIS